MYVLTKDAQLICNHVVGQVRIVATQHLVTINGREALVQNDPESRSIVGCPNIGTAIKPCQLTLPVQRGYSSLVRVDGRPLCLDTVTGLTDGTPPGTVHYRVASPGQALLSEVV